MCGATAVATTRATSSASRRAGDEAHGQAQHPLLGGAPHSQDDDGERAQQQRGQLDDVDRVGGVGHEQHGGRDDGGGDEQAVGDERDAVHRPRLPTERTPAGRGGVASGHERGSGADRRRRPAACCPGRPGVRRRGRGRRGGGAAPHVGRSTRSASLGADPHDFAGLYIRHRSSFALHARRFLRDPRDVDEVVQEAFLRLFLALPELGSELQALSYCRRTITNLCIDRYRADQRRPRLVDLESVPVDVLGDDDRRRPGHPGGGRGDRPRGPGPAVPAPP